MVSFGEKKSDHTCWTYWGNSPFILIKIEVIILNLMNEIKREHSYNFTTKVINSGLGGKDWGGNFTNTKFCTILSHRRYSKHIHLNDNFKKIQYHCKHLMCGITCIMHYISVPAAVRRLWSVYRHRLSVYLHLPPCRLLSVRLSVLLQQLRRKDGAKREGCQGPL